MYVKPETFYAVQNTDVLQLSKLSEDDLRPVLPSLVRSSLCSGLDESVGWVQSRSIILKCISGIEVVNTLVGLLSVDFHELEQDARKKVQLQSKISAGSVDASNQSLLVEFERSDAVNKLRLVVSELLFIMTQIKDNPMTFLTYESELFSNEAYLVEVGDVLCIAQSELPIFLPLDEVAEALLRVDGGPRLVSMLVANNPEYFRDVAEKLIINGPSNIFDPNPLKKFLNMLLERRLICLQFLCKMSPPQSLSLKHYAVKTQKLPELIVSLILNKDFGAGIS